MLSRFAIVAAATLAVGTVGFAADAPNAPTVQPSNSVEKEAKDITATNGVQQAVAQLAQAAVSGNLKDISQYVAESDRQRIESASANQSPDQKLSQFRQDWHQKYGSEFSIPDAVAVLTNPNVQIQSGDLNDQARTAGEKIPADTSSNAPSQTNQPAAVNSGTTSMKGSAANMNGSAAQKGEAANHATADAIPPTATIIIPSNHDLPTVTARFISESEQWKIDIPNNLDGQRLQQNLDEQFGKLDDQKASWSEDPKQAQLMVTHAVLAAMTDAQNISNTGESSPPPMPH
jgi:hypothetical protein